MRTKNNFEELSARKIFQALNLKGWRESYNRPIMGGGQAKVLVVEHESGTKGVFRYLKDENPISLQRFFREVRILTDPSFQHQNIVKILDYSNDENKPWYISELGDSFPSYWKRQREIYQDDPESLLRNALALVLQLLAGLGPLHKANVVHRDIKPANIIVAQSGVQYFPVLIDFGLVYVDDGEGRLTSEDSAVGNAGFSPDVMMNRIDEVVSWLDVFQISQLFIWMLSEKPTKDWTRPLDWRWVNYDKRLSDNSVLSIRAITALCSEEKTSPKDATELSMLIDRTFDKPEKSTEEKVNLKNIHDGIRKGRAIQAIKLAEDIRVINSSYGPVKRIYESLRAEIDHIYFELVSEAIHVRKHIDRFESFYEELTSPSRIHTASIYKLTFGEQGSQQFHFEIYCSVFIPSLRSNFSYPLPETSNIFAFTLQLHASLDRVSFPSKMNWLTYERTGELILRDQQMAQGEAINIPLLAQMIRS